MVFREELQPVRRGAWVFWGRSQSPGGGARLCVEGQEREGRAPVLLKELGAAEPVPSANSTPLSLSSQGTGLRAFLKTWVSTSP